MNASTPKASGSHLQQGALSFGKGMEKSGPARVLTMVFRCRKKGIDYMGQIRVEKEKPEFKVEIFNENYFSHFEAGKNEVLDSLETIILRRLVGQGEIPPGYEPLIRSFLEEKVRPSFPVASEEGRERNGSGSDLQEIFDRLNMEYFAGGIQAVVGWGRDSQTPNRSAIRFGSYDIAKKMIRIHPRLNQDFVPHYVLELTVYHEMCHQWAPSHKKNGTWRDHHPDFKKKEKEYRFFQEARRWEKQNWKKLLQPVEKRIP